MYKKLYKILPATIFLSSIVLASEDVGEIEIMEPNKKIESNILTIHNQTIQNHEETSNTLLYLQNEFDNLSLELEEAKLNYNSKINKSILYNISDDAASIYNDGSYEIFSRNVKKSAMEYMNDRYQQLNYTNTYFDISNLNIISELSDSQFNKILHSTDCQGLGYVFTNIEQQYGINGLFILAIAQQESGLGSSNMAKTKNNLTGFMAYDSNTGNAKRFIDFEDCLMTTARIIKNNYLTEGGKYYHGTSIFDINIDYCSKIDWTTSLIDIMFSNVEKIS